MSHRPEQLAGIIRSIVATFALRIPPVKAKVVSVVDVKLSSDYSYADIYLSAVEGVDRAVTELMSMKGEIRKKMSQEIRIHKLPVLRFCRDEVGERGNRIDELLATISTQKSKKQSRRASSHVDA